tara:strand:- start:235 stop:393 length:159 start_codon:yes stop_codon:yes gene_type:complete
MLARSSFVFLVSPFKLEKMTPFSGVEDFVIGLTHLSISLFHSGLERLLAFLG